MNIKYSLNSSMFIEGETSIDFGRNVTRDEFQDFNTEINADFVADDLNN